MKVLFLSQIVPYPPHGGVLQRGFNIIREASNYNKIYLLAFIHPDILNSEILLDKSKKELSKYCYKIEYFPLWPKKSHFHKYLGYILSLFSKYPFSVLAHRSRSFKERINDILSYEALDLVHFDTIALAQFNNETIAIPKVLTHHNIESKLIERRAKVEKNTLISFYLTKQAQRLNKYELVESAKFDMNIVMSDIDAAILKQKSSAILTTVVPNGVDTDYFYPKNSQELPAIIYTGGMNMFANKDAVLYFLSEIWPHIKARNPDIIFYIIGQDPPNELIEISKNDPGINVTGYVDDVRPYIAMSSVYIVPLRVGGGTRLKVLDAMAQGKAIVSTSIGCEGIEVIPDENILIADDPLYFSSKVNSLLEDQQKRMKLGKAARALVESKYSWHVIAKALQKTYEDAIEHRKDQVT